MSQHTNPETGTQVEDESSLDDGQPEQQSTPGPRREVAKRVFAREFNDATYEFQEANHDRATQWTLLPTGERLNRIFIVGALTEVADLDEGPMRLVVFDGHSKFVVYAGKYTPSARETARELEPPEYVAIVGKYNRFAPEDGDDIYLSIKPESISVVDEEVQQNWVMKTAELTLKRISRFCRQESADRAARDLDVNQAIDQYGSDLSPYRNASINVLETVFDV